jgi:hypothetical protein
VIFSRDIALRSMETWRGETVDATPPPSVKGGFIFWGVNCLGKGRLDWIGKFVLKLSLIYCYIGKIVIQRVELVYTYVLVAFFCDSPIQSMSLTTMEVKPTNKTCNEEYRECTSNNQENSPSRISPPHCPLQLPPTSLENKGLLIQSISFINQ